jgi:selenocysteine lyase/cysteine desulfurase
MQLPCRSSFTFAPSYVNFNHGSFGAVPQEIQVRASEIRLQQQSRPDRFFRESLKDELLSRSREALSDFVHSDPSSLAFVESASFAINTLLRSLVISKKHDAPIIQIMITDSAYMMVQNCLKYLSEKSSEIQLIVVPLRDSIRGSSDV